MIDGLSFLVKIFVPICPLYSFPNTCVYEIPLKFQSFLKLTLN